MKKGSFFKRDFTASPVKSYTTARIAGYERNDHNYEFQSRKICGNATQHGLRYAGDLRGHRCHRGLYLRAERHLLQKQAVILMQKSGRSNAQFS